MNIKRIVKKIKKKYHKFIDVGMIFGSGIDVAELIDDKLIIEYKELGMPCGKVKGHSGKFVFGKINGKNVVLASRYHYYECGNMEQVRLPLMIIKELGAKTVILQSSTGALNSSLRLGQLCVVKDHINLGGNNPLIGMDEIKFINMTNNYNSNYINRLQTEIKSLPAVTHVQFSGPNYETQAEIVMAQKLGGDTVSMSLAYDNLIARYLDLNVLAFAVVTNELDNGNNKSLSHIEVLENAKQANKSVLEAVKTAFEINLFE